MILICEISTLISYYCLLIIDDWRRCQHTSNPLGNGAIVETSNKEVVVLQRSANVGEFPEHFVFPGGHPEVSI